MRRSRRRIRLLAQSFRLAQIEAPELDARLLIGHALNLSRAQLVSQSDRLIEAREIDMISALAARRLSARAGGAHSRRQGILEPRLAGDAGRTGAAAGDRNRGRERARCRRRRAHETLRIVDLGTGSGALLLALLSELPNAAGIGTDISAAALDIARANAARHGLASRCTFIACDGASAVDGPFDLVVSNPPYIATAEIASLPPEVRDYDPALALDGGNDGLDVYRAIAADAPRLLAPGGRLIVELGVGQETVVRTLFTAAGLAVNEARKDLAGIARALSAV